MAVNRVIEIATDGLHLSVLRGFLKISKEKQEIGRVPLDDISALIIHGHGITYSANLVTRLAELGCPMVMCAANHSPVAILWPVNGHHNQAARMDAQIEVKQALKKRLWQQVVVAKIAAQANILDNVGIVSGGVRGLQAKVKSGDIGNIEAQAARRYWPLLMGKDFRRNRDENGINAMLNYGYMVLRAAIARSIIGAGLHPTLAIHHKNASNPMRLADDLMEPFRPLVDLLTINLFNAGWTEVCPETKAVLAKVTSMDLVAAKGASPVQTCMDKMATSLAQVYLGERKTLEIAGAPLAIDFGNLIDKPTGFGK